MIGRSSSKKSSPSSGPSWSAILKILRMVSRQRTYYGLSHARMYSVSWIQYIYMSTASSCLDTCIRFFPVLVDKVFYFHCHWQCFIDTKQTVFQTSDSTSVGVCKRTENRRKKRWLICCEITCQRESDMAREFSFLTAKKLTVILEFSRPGRFSSNASIRRRKPD